MTDNLLQPEDEPLAMVIFDLQGTLATRDGALVDGARAAVARLAAAPGLFLGLATGASRREVDDVLRAHVLSGFFHATRSRSEAAEKPNPQMVDECLWASGVGRERAVMVGDAAVDMEMASAAGIASIGVDWGASSAERLRDAGAGVVIDRFDALDGAVIAAIGPVAGLSAVY